MSPEDVDEEWKEIWKPEHLKTISAFYNTAGGKMIIGRRDDGTYAGIGDVKGTLKSISDTVQNVLGIAVDVHTERFDGIDCIVIDVPRGRRTIDYDGRFYKRVGNTTRMVRREELKDIISNERDSFWMDESSGKTPESLSKDAIARFIEMGKSIGRIPDSVDPSDVESILGRYGLLCDDGTVTIAGVLLFSEHPFRYNCGMFLKIGEFDSRGILRREDIVDVPLILVPDQAVEILFDRYVPPVFGYEGAFRKIVDLYPREGIRELIVNAVVHMDYRSKAPVTVSVHPDRLEVFCFGGLPAGWTAETLVGNHASVQRNKTLATVFHDAGYVENWAQGISKVVKSCKDNKNPSPTFVLRNEGLSVTVSSIDMAPKPNAEWIDLTESQNKILECIVSDPSTTRNGISEATGLTETAVADNLLKLVESGIVRREGNGETGRWVVRFRE